MGVKKRVFEILDLDHKMDAISKGFNMFLLFLIALNILAVVLETVEWIFVLYGEWFFSWRYFRCLFFSLNICCGFGPVI